MSIASVPALDVDPEPPNALSALKVLIYAAEPAASILAVHLQRSFAAQVEIVTELRRCQNALQRSDFSLLIVEESVVAVDPAAAETLNSLAGDALVLDVHFGLSDAERILRGILPALRRKRRADALARIGAERKLRAELGGALTGLMLEAQLALRRAGVDVSPGLHRIVDLAESLCERLQSKAPAPVLDDPALKLHHR